MKTTRNKHNEIVILAKSKFSSIETLISQTLIDSDIRHKEFKTIVDEKEKHEKMKENIRMMKSQKIDAEIDEFNEEEDENIETNKISDAEKNKLYVKDKRNEINNGNA